MPSYVEEKQDIEVPPATGVAGYLKVITDILERPRVQEVLLVKGKISYRRFRKDDEPESLLEIDLQTLMPSAVIRASTLEELRLYGDNAAVAMGQLFSKAHMDGMNPIALVSGPSPHFFAWHAKTTSIVLAADECYGLPFLRDPIIPDESLIMCTAYSRKALLPDTVRTYKITIPFLKERPKT